MFVEYSTDLAAAAYSCSSVFEFYKDCICPSVLVQSYHHTVLIRPGAETHSEDVAVCLNFPVTKSVCVHVCIMEMDIR